MLYALKLYCQIKKTTESGGFAKSPDFRKKGLSGYHLNEKCGSIHRFNIINRCLNFKYR